MEKITNILNWFWPSFFILLLPFLYFFNELFATFSLEIIVFTFLFSSLFFKTGKISPKSTAIFFLSCTYLFLCVRSVIVSVDPSSSLPTALKLFSFLGTGLIFFHFSKNERFIKNCFYVSITTSLLHSYICFAEYIEAPPIPATWIDPGMKDLIRTRCAGIFTDPNIFGSFLSVLFLLNLGSIIKFTSPKNKLWGSIAAIGTGISLLMTLSRGSWAGAGIGLIVFLVLAIKSGKSYKHYLPIAIVLTILTAVFLIGPFKYRFASMTNLADMTISQRSLINKAFINSVKAIPLTGFGLHTFNQVYPRFRVVGGDYPMNAHNEFIHSFLETGPLSALILLALVFTTYSSIPTRTDKTLLAKSAFAAAFTSLVIHNLTGFSSKILPVAIFLPICSAVLLRQYESHSKKLLTLSTFKNSIRFFFGFIVIAAIYLAWGIYDNQLAILKANTLSSSGKPQQALQIALSNQPPLYQSPIQQLLISEILTKLGKTHKAQLALDKALELNPTEAQYYILKAERFPQQSFTQKSNLYEKAIALDPAAEIYRLKFAIFLAEAGKPEKALEQIEIGLKFSPGFHQVYKNYLLLENLQKKLLNRKKESDSEK